MRNIQARDVWPVLLKNSEAMVVDVRTPHEWAAVGLPDLSGVNREVVTITWCPESIKEFQIALQKVLPNKETPIFFICRSGVRSHATCLAAEESGYENVSNILDGFEDRHGPGTGWRASGLPFLLRPLS